MALRANTRRNIINEDELMAEFTHFDGDGNAHMVDVAASLQLLGALLLKATLKWTRQRSNDL